MIIKNITNKYLNMASNIEFNNIKDLNERYFVFPSDAKITEDLIIWRGKEYTNLLNFKKAFEEDNGEYIFNVTTGKYFPVGIKHVEGNVKYLKAYHSDIYHEILGSSSRIVHLYIYYDKISTTKRTCATGMKNKTFASIQEQDAFYGIRRRPFKSRTKTGEFANNETSSGLDLNLGESDESVSKSAFRRVSSEKVEESNDLSKGKSGGPSSEKASVNSDEIASGKSDGSLESENKKCVSKSDGSKSFKMALGSGVKADGKKSNFAQKKKSSVKTEVGSSDKQNLRNFV